MIMLLLLAQLGLELQSPAFIDSFYLKYPGDNCHGYIWVIGDTVFVEKPTSKIRNKAGLVIGYTTSIDTLVRPKLILIYQNKKYEIHLREMWEEIVDYK